MHPLVVHFRKSAYDVYIGRPSKWSNPFSHRPGTGVRWRVDTRKEAVRRYETWVQDQPHLMAALPEIAGRILGCWCAPLLCHGEVLARLAERVLPAQRMKHWRVRFVRRQFTACGTPLEKSEFARSPEEVDCPACRRMVGVWPEGT